MAAGVTQEDQSFQNEQCHVEIFQREEDSLGIGSYGAVYRAKYGELPCAAKILHPILFQTNDPAGQRIVQRFHQECDFLRAVKHPNIVQYLGVTTDKGSGLPILLMELLDESLTNFLEKSRNPLPYHIQFNLCQDIALAIAYLHFKGIVHRDLSSNNVLLIAGSKAKVTDFGMSRLDEATGRVTRHSLTHLPGTQVYMPPEAFLEPPQYTNKIDCFSFGTLVIQMITRLFPNPGPRSTLVPDPRSPTGTTQMPVLEVDRRMNHISLIDFSHPLLPIARQCLEYTPGERPTGQQLCGQLAALKKLDRYTESKEQHIREISDQRSTLVAKDNEIFCLRKQVHTESTQIRAKEMMIQQLEQDLRQVTNEKETQFEQLSQELQEKVVELEEKEAQNEDLHQQLDQASISLKVRETDIEQLGEQLRVNKKLIRDFQQTLAQRDQVECQAQNDQEYQELEKANAYSRVIDLRWKKVEKPAACKMYHGSAAVSGNTIYFRNGRNNHIYQYNLEQNKWTKIPNCPKKGFSLAFFEGSLTAIGGIDSDSLLSLVQEDGTRKWGDRYPPMPTKRYNTTAECNEHILIVAGGMVENNRPVHTVELMDVMKHQWYTACDLAHPLYDASATICGDNLYLTGWKDQDGQGSNGTLTCSLAQLEQTAIPHTLGSRLLKAFTGTKPSVTECIWKRIADLPTINSMCVTINSDQLLAIGGEDPENMEYVRNIYRYNQTSDVWEIVSKMPTARSSCLVAAVLSKQLIVVGGYIGVGTYTDVINVASF